MLDLGALVTFAEVVRAGSFSAAGRRMGRSRQSVHREVVRLEGELDLILLARTTRHVRMTDAGRRLFRHAERLLEGARAATAAMAAAASIQPAPSE